MDIHLHLSGTGMEDWDRVHATNYEARVFWDIHWIRSADALIASAQELEPRIAELWESYRKHHQDREHPLKADLYQGPYFMLLAFAVENLLKASLVQRRSAEYRRQFQETKRFPNDLLGHNLVPLASKAGLNYSIDEEDLLRRLTRHAVWAGRYPGPVNYGHSAPGAEFSDGRRRPVAWFGGDDIPRLKALITKIRTELELAPPGGD